MTKGKSGIAEKGSRYSLQYYMKTKEGRDFLSELILSASSSLLSFIDLNNGIDWKSPLPEPESSPNKAFYEYRDDFLEVLVDKNNLQNIYDKVRIFWPQNGPQWDGLAAIKGDNGIRGALLIEAKSHLAETRSSIKATLNSEKWIKDTLKLVQEAIGVKTTDWTHEFYQLGNRIAFLYLMNEILNIPAWLVLINFIDDPVEKTSIHNWIIHYNNLFKKMGIKSSMKIIDRIITIYPEGKNKQEDNKQV